MASRMAMDSPPQAQAGSGGRRQQIKAQVGAAEADVLQAAMPVAAAPSRPAAEAGRTKFRCRHKI
jgi:hypothetical protein